MLPWLEGASYVVTILGVPAFILTWLYTRQSESRQLRDEALQRRWDTFLTLDEAYCRFVRLCIERPELDIFEVALPDSMSIEERQEVMAFTELISVMESAYVLFHDPRNQESRGAHWAGWASWIEAYSERESFRNAWKLTGGGTDEAFSAYVNGLVERVEQR